MGQKRILVVDDEAVLRELLADILAREGHQVDTACDGLAGCGKTGLLRPGQDDSSATMRITLPQEVRMRGDDRQQGAMYSYISPEARVPHDHPLRAIRGLVADCCVSCPRASRGCTPGSAGRRSRRSSCGPSSFNFGLGSAFGDARYSPEGSPARGRPLGLYPLLRALVERIAQGRAQGQLPRATIINAAAGHPTRPHDPRPPRLAVV